MCFSPLFLIFIFNHFFHLINSEKKKEREKNRDFRALEFTRVWEREGGGFLVLKFNLLIFIKFNLINLIKM